MTEDKLLFTGSSWNFELIERTMDVLGELSKELKLDIYPNEISIITSEQMLDAYCSAGVPVMYKHWSFGKSFIREEKSYKAGHSGLAYEIVLNMDPCINYLMEENSATTQVLILAHAGFGHNHFFKNNYLFRMWTDASSILDYLIFAKNYVAECEEKYGEKEVEAILDSCHALQNYGVDKYKRPNKISMVKEKANQKEREEYLQSQVNILWDRTVKKKKVVKAEKEKPFPEQPEENILYFLEKNSPNLEPWQRELIRIVRKISQYFYPQRQCISGDNLISTETGLIKLRDYITDNGYNLVSDKNLLTYGDKYTEISHTYKTKAKVKKITTKTGRVFIGTLEHPLMSLSGIQQSLKEIGDFQIGDFLVYNLDYKNVFATVDRKLTQYEYDSEPVECKICGLKSNFIGSHIVQMHSMTTLDYINEYDSPISNELSRLNKSVNFPKKFPEILTPDFCELLAFLQYANTNENDTMRGGFKFKSEKINCLRFIELLDSVFEIKISLSKGEWGYFVEFSSVGLTRFLYQNCQDVLFLKRNAIPKIIFEANRDGVSRFFKSYFDVRTKLYEDGKLRIVRTTDSNYENLQDINVLLISLGIVSKIKKKKEMSMSTEFLGTGGDFIDVYYYKLEIHPSFYSEYIKIIGSKFLDLFDRPDNNEQIVFPNAKDILNKVRNYFIDKRKEFFDKNREEIKNSSYFNKKANGLLYKYTGEILGDSLPYILNSKNIKRTHLINSEESFKILYSLVEIFPEIEKLQTYLEDKSVFYDEVVSIEYIEEEQEVYDVTVPENHLFWTSGLISHNTKIMNEGWASFTHYYLMNRLWDEGYINDGSMLEFLALHTGVLYQPNFSDKWYSGLNPYYLGFEMFSDIRRMCEKPDDEDRKYFPELMGKNWLEVCLDAVENYRDESFIRQFLGPKVIRKLKLFSILDSELDDEYYTVENIHNEQGFKSIRNILADIHENDEHLPKIEVFNANIKGDRTLTLMYYYKNGRVLGASAEKVLKHVQRLWGYPVRVIDSDKVPLFDE